MDRPPYQVVARLYAVAEDYWHRVDAAYSHLNLIKEEPHRFCNLIYAWLEQFVQPDQLEQFEAELTAPLPGRYTKPSQTEMELEGESFMAAMQMLGG